ncbi:LOW QUALITY PROTEIN: flavin-containing monooxygenase FMO GS-OX5-like [Homarus americanus]|uniref:LOW QUALITY PROTEIN: flavin-containing monooxygenase FMO GS-OX5-like n=1 Tax=Homarus americanus TaxID=6706 RepID=UPI001C444358|nr:LOW QUALITY PROTEIN: flavin-containing monooxygenase FMO GS-OX5-like [Homarus americanus]
MDCPEMITIFQAWRLQTDLPKMMMAFPDFAFPEEGESFVHHTAVLKYLEDYAHQYDLLSWIKFGHRVEKVCPVLKEEGPSWDVTVKRVDLPPQLAMFVCNGHFTVPFQPHIEGIEEYRGQQVHSHDYRQPSPYTGSRVLVLGFGLSGLDISLELSTVAEEVLLSHKLPVSFPSEMPPNIRQVPGVVKATQEGFEFADGSWAQANSILYCTGYKYNFPFLMEECGIQVKDNCVKPLYKHLINSVYPSMALIGIPSRIIVFPIINYQVQYFIATLTGRVKLPTPEEMFTINHKIHKDWTEQGLQEKHFHMLNSDQWQYMDDLATEAGLVHPPPFLKKMWKIIMTRLFLSFPMFKGYDYSLNKDGTIVEARNGQILNTSWDLGVLAVKQLIRLVWRDFSRVMCLLGSLIIKKMKKLLYLS